MRAAAVLGIALALPAAAAALEPRFDHRDTHGPFVEGLLAHDTVARSGAPTVSSWRPTARIAWGFDVSGVGDDLIAGALVALRSFDDPERARVLLGVDVRYRGYFGADELKTFFDVGAWAPLRSRLAAGPLVGLGLAWDFSRYAGVYLSGTFATAFG
ncbi:MAG TPA: hypothetical protein VIW03_19165, partial [Anaeromyxobacter sp.]